MYAIANTIGREDQVCFVVGRTIFDAHASGVSPFFTYWGGEAIRGGPAEVSASAGIGVPSIVVARLDMTRPHNDPYARPPLANLFVATTLGFGVVAAEIFYPRPIAAEDVLDIWHPGDPGYDQHPGLPRL